MRKVCFVLTLLVLGITACISGNNVPKETAPTPTLSLNLLVTTKPRTPTPNPSQTANVETPVLTAQPLDRSQGKDTAAQLFYPELHSVEPAQVEPGQSIKIIARGGYITWEDAYGTGYDESYRTFKWFLDNEYQGEIGCYVNYCETEFELPQDIGAGTHIVEVEGGSQISFEVGER